MLLALACLLSVTTQNVLASEVGKASYYGKEECKKDGTCFTASGKDLRKLEADGILFAAKWDVPFGTRYEVRNRNNGKKVIAEIWDRGPNRRLSSSRIIDLCEAAFAKIADKKEGLVPVEITRLP